MITKRKLNKKLDLLLHRQNLLAMVVFKTQLTSKEQKKNGEGLVRYILQDYGWQGYGRIEV